MTLALTREAVVATAMSWMGTPFHHQAATKGAGVDCIGLVRGVAAELGVREAAEVVADPEFAGYGRLPDPVKLLSLAARYLDMIQPGSALCGDVLLFRILQEPMHFAIVSRVLPHSGVRYIVHAYQPAGGVVEHVVDAKWHARIVRAYRFKGLT